MKTNFRFLALSAAILSMFTACQREELEQNQKPETLTHSVTFVAGAPETKTTATIEGNTVNYSWTAEDVDRFTVYENGIAAKTVTAALGTDGTMSMKATFPGEAPASPKYQALYNSEVSANQNIVKDSYAEVSDVMVSNVLDGTRDDNFVFSFKREVAFAKMTLKSLTSGAYVSSVTIESDKPIAGKYDLKTGTFVNTSNVITLDILTDVANGNATVWFTTIPVEDATFTITAETINEDMTVAATYTKTFSKTITLTRGDVKGFGVAMVKNTPKTYGYQKISEVSDYTPGDYIIVAHVYKDDCPTKGDFAIANDLSISSKKLLGKEVTNFIDNDVISVSDGASYKLSLSGDKENIVISNGTNILAYNGSSDLVLNGDKKYWTLSLNEGNGGTFLLLNNSTAKASTKRALSFQSYSTSGSTKTASLKFGAYAASNINKVDYAAIELYKYQEVTPSTPKYSVTIAEITGGTLSATPSKAEAGAEVTLIATPDAEYTFNNDWTVTNAETSETIYVKDGKFTMPAANVNVSASFTQKTYTITANAAENGTYTVKVGDTEVTSAVKGDKVVLEATPDEGYLCDGWTVVDLEGKNVSVSNNSFYMPSSNVTISTSFSLKPEDITFNKLTSSLTDYSGEYLMLHSNDYVVSGVTSKKLATVALEPNVGDQIMESDIPASAAVLTIEASTTTGYYTIKFSDNYYLGWSEKTDFSTNKTADTDNYLWSISITNSSATIENKESKRIIKWYAPNKDFRPYTTTQSYDLPVLYKKN